MKRPSLTTIIFIICLILIILIDLPENYPVNINIFNKKIKTEINPISLDVNLFGNKIRRNFTTQLGLDLKGGSRLLFDVDTSKVSSADRNTAVEAARDIIERRGNFFGVSEPNVSTLKSGGQYRLSVDLPATDDLAATIDLISKTAHLDFRTEASLEASIATQAPLYVLLSQQTDLTGKDIKRSSVDFDNQGKPAVGLEFNSAGGKKFAEITGSNVRKRIAIYLDEMILSAPTVSEKIIGGRAMITGDFTLDQAKQLSVAINSGSLPVPIKLIEQRNIGPTLGEAQIKNSIFAGLVGLMMVILFMIIYYGRLGIIAIIGLIIYGLISMAIFRIVPIVLTLPGIAGFILSIGMAVDSNILIFERIKEELRAGKSQDIAIRLGFGRAIDAIKDANLTTILVAFILFNPLNWDFLPQFGLVKGFALTLFIGVATSLFTGVVITKRLINMFYKKT